jgi:hypothetical protein
MFSRSKRIYWKIIFNVFDLKLEKSFFGVILFLVSFLSPVSSISKESIDSYLQSEFSSYDEERDARNIEELFSRALFKFGSNSKIDIDVDGCRILVRTVTNSCLGETSVAKVDEVIDLNEIDRLVANGDLLPNGSVAIMFIFHDKLMSHLSGLGLEGLLQKSLLDELGVRTRRVLRHCNDELSHMTFIPGPRLFYQYSYYEEVFRFLIKYKKNYCLMRE